MSLSFILMGLLGLLFFGALLFVGGWFILVYIVNRQRDDSPPDNP